MEAELPGIADLNVFLESEPRESAAAIGLASNWRKRRRQSAPHSAFSTPSSCCGGMR